MSFLGIGPLEIIVILVIALIVLGPERMMDAAKTLGRFVRDAKDVAAQVPRVVVEDDDVKIVSDGKATSLIGDNPPERRPARPNANAAPAPSAEDAPASDDDDGDAPVAFSRQSAPAPESESESGEKPSDRNNRAER